mgnify:CR=1 FL=1
MKDYYRRNVIDFAMLQLDKKYEWGEIGEEMFDCSGLTYYVFHNECIYFLLFYINYLMYFLLLMYFIYFCILLIYLSDILILIQYLLFVWYAKIKKVLYTTNFVIYNTFTLLFKKECDNNFLHLQFCQQKCFFILT